MSITQEKSKIYLLKGAYFSQALVIWISVARKAFQSMIVLSFKTPTVRLVIFCWCSMAENKLPSFSSSSSVLPLKRSRMSMLLLQKTMLGFLGVRGCDKESSEETGQDSRSSLDLGVDFGYSLIISNDK